MKQFMITSRLPEEFTREFLSRIPEQRSTVNRLLEEGTILSYSLSGDRSMLWTVLEAESEIDVLQVLAQFPLNRFMKSEITELLFHNSVSSLLPQPSLN
jgi:muconolactone delta-isomerase